MVVCETTHQRRRDSSACRVFYCNPHMAQRMELLWQHCQELVGRELLMDEFCGITDQKLRKPHGRSHLDTDLRACPHDRDAACDEHRQKINQNEGQNKLGADGAAVPPRPQKATLRTGRVQRCNRCCRLRGDARPPRGPMASAPSRKATAQPPTFVCVSGLFWHCNPCKRHSPTHFEPIQLGGAATCRICAASHETAVPPSCGVAVLSATWFYFRHPRRPGFFQAAAWRYGLRRLARAAAGRAFCKAAADLPVLGAKVLMARTFQNAPLTLR
jgi:hypothetical protein